MLMRFIEIPSFLRKFLYGYGREPPLRGIPPPKAAADSRFLCLETIFDCVGVLGLSDFQLSLQYAPRNQEMGP